MFSFISNKIGTGLVATINMVYVISASFPIIMVRSTMYAVVHMYIRTYVSIMVIINLQT